MEIVTLETPSLGDRSYLVHTGGRAAVIDPQRDIDRMLAALDERDLELVAVLETHIHNDYVTGGLQLAAETGASYHVAAAEDLAYERTPVRDGDRIRVGDLVLRAVHTPGHTPTHLSYVASEGGGVRAVFSGGGLLYGSVGRTDLLGDELTEQLTRQQFRSARRLADQLPDHTTVLPTHGFGSFCSSGDTTGRDRSTVGRERRENQALTTAGEDAFVRDLLAGLDAYPAYYAHMAPVNRSGPAPVDLSALPDLDLPQLREHAAGGGWSVDLRSRRAFAAGHLPGTVNIELADATATYLGWLMPWGRPVALLGETAGDVATAQRQLVRIGIDRPAGQATVDTVRPAATASYRVSDLAGLREARRAGARPVVLDVRSDGEWAAGHLPGAVHVPLHELPDRLDELPSGRLWVHCATGYRASIAASLLDRAGREVVLVDDEIDPDGSHAVRGPRQRSLATRR